MRLAKMGTELKQDKSKKTINSGLSTRETFEKSKLIISEIRFGQQI
jgi:hypothetical protein